MAKKPTSHKNAGGLHSKKDPRQDDLRDERQGAYDPVGNQKVPDTNHQTKHERAQTGATFVASLYPTENFELPEGLKRPRMGPYDRDRKRDDIPNEVPGPKGGRG
jgi:hypothetical protein